MTETIEMIDRTVEETITENQEQQSTQSIIKYYRSLTTEYHSLPAHVPEPYIMSSYRVNLTFKEALLSLFALHNETMNIWTSLISFVIFSVQTYRVCFHLEMNDVFHRLSYIVFCCGALYTFGASTVYHWFNCMSFRHHQTLLRIDISGIGMLILGCFYPPIYYSFYCHPYWGTVYIVASTVGCIIASVVFLVPRYTTDTYRFFRICLFVSICSLALLPTTHLLMIYGTKNTLFIEASSGVLQMCVICLTGLLFYATKIPERFSPGKFDVMLHSHQFWHSFILVATVLHWNNMNKIRSTFRVHPCYGMSKEFGVDVLFEDSPLLHHSAN